jgi:hypothetical protein
MFWLPKDIWMPILRFRVAKTQPDNVPFHFKGDPVTRRLAPGLTSCREQQLTQRLHLDARHCGKHPPFTLDCRLDGPAFLRDPP